MKQFIWLHQSDAISVIILTYLTLQRFLYNAFQKSSMNHRGKKLERRSWRTGLMSSSNPTSSVWSGRIPSYNGPVWGVQRCVGLFYCSLLSSACNLIEVNMVDGRVHCAAGFISIYSLSFRDLMNCRSFSYCMKQLHTADTVTINDSHLIHRRMQTDWPILLLQPHWTLFVGADLNASTGWRVFN